MNETLKAAGHIGAELGAAIAENERLRGLLEEAADHIRFNDLNRAGVELLARIKAALSPQTEPECLDCRAYQENEQNPNVVCDECGWKQSEQAEPAPAQDDGRSAFQAYLNECAAYDIEPSIAGAFHLAWQASPGKPIRMPPSPYTPDVEPESMTDYERGEAQGRCDMWAMVKGLNAASPAQTEQQPTVKDCLTVQPMAYVVFAANGNVACFSTQRDHPSLVALEADGHSVVSLAPIAQTAPQELRIVFDGPPGPEAGRFVEVENADGRSVNAGEWRERADGLWELALHGPAPQPEQSELVEMVDAAMMEMRNIAPPLRRSDCERLIRAALSSTPSPAQRGES